MGLFREDDECPAETLEKSGALVISKQQLQGNTILETNSTSNGAMQLSRG